MTAKWQYKYALDAAYEYARQLKDDNAKLRELVRDWWSFAVGGADSLSDWNAQQADLESRMRELGVEVPDVDLRA